MKKKIILSFVLLLLFFNKANAGLQGLTIHSRANCVNNESISWDATRAWDLFTTSDHGVAATGQLVHSNATGWQKTWRSHSIHWGEGGSGWYVHGWHWIGNLGRVWSLGDELVYDCSIYDGW
jgi:hypothetical protein